MIKVLGMGNALVDVLIQVNSDKELDNLGLPKGSMQLINKEQFIELSSQIDKTKASIVAGGSASNTIVGLANLGITTGFVGRVGNDSFGKLYQTDLIHNKVTPHLTTVEEASGVATTFISPDGERTFATYLGAAALLDAQDLDAEIFKTYDYLFIEGYLLQSYELIQRAVKLAKQAGCKIALDLASYNVVESNREFLEKLIPEYVDILFANEEEAKAMTGLEPEQAVTQLSQMVNIAVAKAGADGSWIQRGTEKFFVSANKVNCLDSTGAGDLYAAGFLYGILNNTSLEKAGQVGTLLAGEVIQLIGPKIDKAGWDRCISKIKTIK